MTLKQPSAKAACRTRILPASQVDMSMLAHASAGSSSVQFYKNCICFNGVPPRAVQCWQPFASVCTWLFFLDELNLNPAKSPSLLARNARSGLKATCLPEAHALGGSSMCRQATPRGMDHANRRLPAVHKEVPLMLQALWTYISKRACKLLGAFVANSSYSG